MVFGDLPRLSHANRDRTSRLAKASRIDQILRHIGVDLRSADVLEIGTGAGIIAGYFVKRARTLMSVDIVDERIDDSFAFMKVESELLPFSANSFDVLISNHVVEHVLDQPVHLAEIERVLRPGGLCYLATPNRLWPMEPHFGLPLLAWLPSQHLQDRYVRLCGKGDRYDARLLTFSDLRRLSGLSNLALEEVGFDVARLRVLQKTGINLSWTRGAWVFARWLAPSLVVILRKAY